MLEKSLSRGGAASSGPTTPTEASASFATSLRALPPLRLATSVRSGPQGTKEHKEEEKVEDEVVEKEEPEPEDNDECEDEDEDEGLGFVIEGEEAACAKDDDEDGDGDEDLGFTVDTGSEVEKEDGAFNVWNLLTADDEVPAA